MGLECPHCIAIAFSQRALSEYKDTERERETEIDRETKRMNIMVLTWTQRWYACVLWITPTDQIQYERGLHNGMNTKKLGIIWAIWETCYQQLFDIFVPEEKEWTFMKSYLSYNRMSIVKCMLKSCVVELANVLIKYLSSFLLLGVMNSLLPNTFPMIKK